MNAWKNIYEGKDYIVLVRITKIERAKQLYDEVYNKLYKKYNPVLIISKLPANEKKNRIKNLRDLKSRIVVCVDMFGEGIDIPNLKIVAIHDKYLPLPVTLQFVGRFARAKEELGDASVITNIAD
ncbi:helicase-related protein [Intestinibacter sp.]